MSKKMNDIAASMAFEVPKPVPMTQVQEQDATAFETPKPTESKPVKTHSRLRADKRGERLCCYLPPKLHEKLRVKCARDRRSLSDAVTDAVTLWLQGTS